MPHAIQVPTPDRLLRAWETGRGATPERRALLVLAACCPGAEPGVLAALPIGSRDRLLITAHRAMFAPVYDCVADCSRCGCLLEAELPLDQLIEPGAPDDDAAPVDPGAEVALSVRLICPDCGTGSDLVLDPLAFLWAELDDWAGRLLAEVHALASGYGWAEDAILSMSHVRRSAYLTLLATEGVPGAPAVFDEPIAALAAEPLGSRR